MKTSLVICLIQKLVIFTDRCFPSAAIHHQPPHSAVIQPDHWSSQFKNRKGRSAARPCDPNGSNCSCL